jgi:hypothetical protein
MHTAHPLDKETVRSKLTYAQIMGMRRKPANLCSNHGDATKQAGGKSITTEDEAPSANPQTKKQRVPKLRRGKESPPKKKEGSGKGKEDGAVANRSLPFLAYCRQCRRQCSGGEW